MPYDTIIRYNEINNPTPSEAYKNLTKKPIKTKEDSKKIYIRPKNALEDFKTYSQFPRIQRMLEQ